MGLAAWLWVVDLCDASTFLHQSNQIDSPAGLVHVEDGDEGEQHLGHACMDER